jgi:hypothetical protein
MMVTWSSTATPKAICVPPHSISFEYPVVTGAAPSRRAAISGENAANRFEGLSTERGQGQPRSSTQPTPGTKFALLPQSQPGVTAVQSGGTCPRDR